MGTLGFRLVSINRLFLDLPLWVRRGGYGSWLGLGVALLYAAGWASLLSPAAQRRWGPRAVLSLTQGAMGVLLAALPLVNEAITAAIPKPLRVSAPSILDLPALAVTIGAEVGVGLLADTHLAWALFGSGALLAAATSLWWGGRPTNRGGPKGPVEDSA